MKRRKRLYILLGILVAASVMTFAVTRVEEHKEKIKNSDEVVLEVDTDAVESLSWEYQGETLSFHKEDGTWVYDEDAAFPVDEEKIQNLLSLFEEFGASFTIEEVEDYGQYGLEDPLCTIDFATADTSYKITLGDYSTMDSERYVSTGDGNVYLAATDPLDSYNVELSDMIKNDEVPSFDSVSEIRVAGVDDYAVTYTEDSTDSYNDEDVYFTELDGETLPLDSTQVEDYLDTLEALSLTDYETYQATEEDLESFGLADPELTFSVDYTTEDEDDNEESGTFTISVARDPEEAEKAAEEEAKKAESSDTDDSDDDKEEEITAYARIGESSIIYRITGEEYKALIAASRDDFRYRKLVTFDFGEVTSIDISLEGSSYTLTSDGKDDDKTWHYGGKEIEIAELQTALEELKANTFTDESPSQKEEIAVTLHLDDEDHPELSICLYRYDGSDCLAEVNKEPQSLVTRSKVVDLIEAVNSIVLNETETEETE